MHSASTPTPTPTFVESAPVDGGAAWRLPVLLSAIALVAFAMRAAAQAQAMASAGAPMDWTPTLMTELANWAGWTLWGLWLAPTTRRLLERSPGGATQAVSLLGLAVVPILLVPLMVSPVHRIGFGQGTTTLQSYQHVVTHNAPLSLLLGVTMLAVANGYLGLQRARRLETTAAQLATALSRAQLDTLRSQLNPHFLFNALNSIAVLARRGQVVPVEEMVTRLAGLLRHSLDSAGAQLVPLRVEAKALQHYLEIEQVRHGSRLVVSLDFPADLHGVLVPSFILQPLVENAIRHGLTDPRRPLHVAVTGRIEGDGMVVTITDDGAGIADHDPPPDGLGLGNSRARLAGLYGPMASLSLSPGEGGRGTRVTLLLPRQPSRDAAG